MVRVIGDDNCVLLPGLCSSFFLRAGRRTAPLTLSRNAASSRFEEKQGVGRQGGRESFFKKLPIKQSMTYQDREFFIVLVVSEKNGPEKSLRAGIGKIWYRKKYRYRYRKYLVPEKSIGIGIV